MKLHHKIASLLGALALASAGIVATAPTAQAVTCGDVESDWTGLLASVWTSEMYFDSTDYDTVLTLTNLSNLSVIVNLDTLGTYNGSYSFSPGTNQLIYSGTSPLLGNPFDRLTMDVSATSCNGNRVTAASGNIIRQDVGVVGVVYQTRTV